MVEERKWPNYVNYFEKAFTAGLIFNFRVKIKRILQLLIANILQCPLHMISAPYETTIRDTTSIFCTDSGLTPDRNEHTARLGGGGWRWGWWNTGFVFLSETNLRLCIRLNFFLIQRHAVNLKACPEREKRRRCSIPYNIRGDKSQSIFVTLR